MPKWTADEDARLRELYGTMPVKEVAQMLGRSRWAVLTKAGQLKLDGKPIRWGEGEKALLTLLYPTTPIPEVCRLLGRPEGQVRGMASTMGLKRTPAAKQEVAHRRLPVGSERPNHHGQMMRKVKDSGPHREKWKRVDILTWEEANGPVPPGKIVTVRDQAKPPTADNLMLVTRADLAARNHPDSHYPPEVVQLIRLKASITRQINRMGSRAESEKSAVT